jgi:prepilin-type N-terminal cleavage/methylation domain-containing protein
MRKIRQMGFTLIELILVIVIISVISIIVGRLLFQSLQTFIVSQNVSSTDWQGLLTLNRFSNDVHNIRSENDISTITSSSFAFVDLSGASVSYSLSSSTLQRNGISLATGVSGLTFAYYDKNYSVTVTPANVRYISISANFTSNNLTQSFATLVGTRGMS